MLDVIECLLQGEAGGGIHRQDGRAKPDQRQHKRTAALSHGLLEVNESLGGFGEEGALLTAFKGLLEQIIRGAFLGKNLVGIFQNLSV